ncbi:MULTISPECIES: Nramp family divalent metal transporter [Bacillus]|nr:MULTISPECIES: Nramp family divalent metal transporter [Bacillus]MBP1081227.1 Mn2+/Fe2+ NRAMP family transporter [Bacillus capparidis]MED1095907.1 Nramp family divalent metal transporter [Bacillus capparidis]
MKDKLNDNSYFSEANPVPPKTVRQKLALMGPGLVVAATGVGTADLVTAIVAGTSFGMTFVWAIVVGAILKYFLNEGVGRWYLATGKTILQGWHAMGKWATGYFGIYSVIWGFLYGATASLTCGLGMHSMFPVMPIWAWAMLHSLAGFILVWTGRYLLFERVMTVLIGIMFVTIIGTAFLFLPSIGEFSYGFVPRVPEGSLMLTLGLIGGVGGTITMASYGYWLQEKGWKGKGWVAVMRLDAKTAYVITSIFTLAALIIGAKFLFGTGIEIKGDQGLLNLAQMLGDEFGAPLRWLFLIAFWSAAFTSLLGVWNGVPYLFADFIRTIRSKNDTTKPVTENDPAYRIYLAWLTFPPMLIFFYGKPIELIILYGVLGALFMPFLATSLVILLNSKKVEPEFRNNWIANTVLIGCLLMFIVLGISELIDLF